MIVYEKKEGKFVGKINDDAYREKSREEIEGHLQRASQIICEDEKKKQQKDKTA